MDESIFSFLWWIGLIIAAIAGGIITSIYNKLYSYLKNRKKFKGIKILGTWYTYNMTNKGNKLHLAKYIWEFKKDFVAEKIVALGSSALDETIKYEAEMEIKDKNIFLYGRGEAHGENAAWVFKRNYPHTTQTTFCGAFLGIDYYDKLFCGIALLSKNELKEKYIHEVFEERFEKCKSSNSSTINLLQGPGEFHPD